MTYTLTSKADLLPVTEWNAEAEADAIDRKFPTHSFKSEGDPYEFYRGEVRLGKAMGMAVAASADLALVEFDNIVDRAGHSLKAGRFDLVGALRGLVPVMQKAWNTNTSKLVEGIIGDLSELGARRAGAFKRFESLPTRALIEEGMVASSKYYTNNYFNRVVMPSMVGDINAKIDSGAEFDDAFFKALRQKMDTRLKSVPYWRMVGNQAASRSYHYGLTRAGLSTGKTGYRLKATLDERTSEVCENLHGKTFWLADAVAHLEKIARVDPEGIKEADPWVTLKDIEGKTGEQLTKEGIMTPPFHASCRTTLVMV